MNDDDLTFEQLLSALFDGDDAPIHLLYQLSDLSWEKNQAFLERWGQEEERRRQVIARHMADISEENYLVDFSLLFGEMLSDQLEGVRMAALDGLWDCTNMALLNPVMHTMQHDESARVRALAAATLGHIVLLAEWGQIDMAPVERVVESLVSIYADPLAPDEVRRAALESLGASGDARVPTIIHEAYYTGDEDLQVAALFAMGRSADSRWLPVILDEMESTHSEMRIEAARAAGSIGDSDAVEQLVQLADDDEELEVRLAALTALGQIGSDRACEALRGIAEATHATDEEQDAAQAAYEEATWIASELDFSILSLDADDGS